MRAIIYTTRLPHFSTSPTTKVHLRPGSNTDTAGDVAVLLAKMTQLRTALESIWDEGTSVDATFDKNNPALGQCVPTALLVQELYGGEISRVVVGGISHYYNSLELAEIDLTRDQFTTWAPSTPETRTTEEIVANEYSARRSKLLSARYAKL